MQQPCIALGASNGHSSQPVWGPFPVAPSKIRPRILQAAQNRQRDASWLAPTLPRNDVLPIIIRGSPHETRRFSDRQMNGTDDPPPNLSQDEIEPIERAAAVVTPPPLPSPTLSSPVSLYRLGISPYSKQFSSPRAPGPPWLKSPSVEIGHDTSYDDQADDHDQADDSQDYEHEQTHEQTHEHANDGDVESNAAEHSGDSPSSEDPIALDSKDVLLQRLGDLMQRLNSDDTSFKDENLSALHSKVDEMEDVLEGSPHPLLRSQVSDLTNAIAEAPLLKPPAERKPVQIRRPKPAISAEDASRIAQEAEELSEHLTSIISRLQSRQEESEHIHALLIDRAERAAQRIIVLEDHVQNLQANLHEYDTELASLRIALKAIEVQCPPPSNMDEDLRRSIQKWKADWKSVKEKRASRSLRESSFLSSAPATPR
ncbi:hypothetical protein SAPIO_CDS1048 [Scedosporium apiospermum]|uniref:Uncharacterized protein n=1 Tax=Pseudallescheria apiosperma TaxID=563466 RepID=A0A084GFR1_PSEDA|nr:uncharacterized protein SAPIO_CDS1048 [Scedosporium apiospermum]KEZ46173.1 hypothetical protein SAPIO_CDS1048 [Scedosporium apiospermum]